MNLDFDLNALIGFLTLFVAILVQGNIYSKSMGILENKVDELGKKQDKHNGLIERMVKVESSTSSAHRRLDEMEHNCHQVMRERMGTYGNKTE